MVEILVVVCICFLILLVIFVAKYVSLKRNICHFTQELEYLKDDNYRQPVKIDDFDKDLAKLAVRINEHTQMRQQIRNEYEQSKKRFGTIISGISHDFRTPLTASLGYLQMMEKSGELSPSNAEYLSIVKQKNRYLKELSDEFFEMTKLQKDEEECELEAVNLSNVLTEMLLEQHTWIEKRGIETEFDIAEGIVIQSNLHYLARMINNMFSNAQKYSEERFEVTLKREEEQIVLRVCNRFATGVTIDVNRVFEPFYRMDSRTENGSGLGLYVVKLLADKLGWKVAAEIKNGIFSIILYIP